MKVEVILPRNGEQTYAVVNATLAGDNIENPIAVLKERITNAVDEWALSSDAGCNALESVCYDFNIADLCNELSIEFSQATDPDTLEYYLSKNGILELSINLHQVTDEYDWSYDSYLFSVEEDDVNEAKDARDHQTQKRIED